MKKIISILAAIFVTTILWAQSPQKMSYQAVIRDAGNNLDTNHAVGMKISILQGSVSGTAVYTETQTTTTNANGLISIEIGGGTGFNTIDWANGPYFIKTETDVNGGTSYTITAISQLLSVPYALHAKTAENGFSGNYNDLTNQPTTDGSETKVTAGTNVTLTGTGTTANPYIINSTGGSISLLPPTATVQAASNIQNYTATINGTVNANGLSTTVVFEWGLTTAYGSSVTATQSPVTGTSNIAVNAYLYDLQSNTTYHYRVKAANAVNITYSGDITFTTTISAPQLTTTAITSILAYTATTGGNITYDGGAAVYEQGVCYSTSPTPTIANDTISAGTGSVSFVSNLIGLTPATTYYVRAYAINVVGTSYGNEISFSTLTLPTVTTSSFSDIKGNSAYAGGSVTDDGGSTIIAQGLSWSTSVNPTTANSFNTSFTAIMSVLLPSTVYYVRAYATNIAGTGYGNQISFNSGYLIGSTYGGGLVFNNDGNAHGLVCAPTDQSSLAEWGCDGTAIGGTLTDINTGAANTNAIVLGCTTAGIAAKLCYDLVLSTYTDWYLPSKDELNLMYQNLQTQSLGGFASEYYWSSSEYAGSETDNAWFQNFNGGQQNLHNKSNPRYVRAVRAF